MIKNNKIYTPIPLYKIQMNDYFCHEPEGNEFKVIKIIHDLIYYIPVQVEQGKRPITRYLPHTSNTIVYKITP